jgi:hypothetical protein
MGNAESCHLFAVKDFIVHFRLKNRADDLDETLAPVELEGFGEDMIDFISVRLYPIYAAAVREAADELPEKGPTPPEQLETAIGKINHALDVERRRQATTRRGKRSSDPEAAALQEAGHDIPKALAERIVKGHRRPRRRPQPPSKTI